MMLRPLSYLNCLHNIEAYLLHFDLFAQMAGDIDDV